MMCLEKRREKQYCGGLHFKRENNVLCTHVILRNSDGRFLIQQRSAIKATRPGVWDITAGAVDAGENSLDGALREAQEEIGLQLSREKMQFLFRDQRKHTFHDVYYICMPFTLEQCKMQESEVQALRLADKETFFCVAAKYDIPFRQLQESSDFFFA